LVQRQVMIGNVRVFDGRTLPAVLSVLIDGRNSLANAARRGDPTVDITTTRNIRAVRFAGARRP
jgi:hypothetical protein